MAVITRVVHSANLNVSLALKRIQGIRGGGRQGSRGQAPGDQGIRQEAGREGDRRPHSCDDRRQARGI